MAVYSDILIEHDDIKIDGSNNAVIILDRAVIAQDIIHMIRESGHLEQMIAERDYETRLLLRTKIQLLVEEDTRIIPGTVRMESGLEGKYYLFADTYEFGRIADYLISF